MESIVNLKSKLLGTNPNESTPLSRAIFFVIIGIAFYLLDRFSLFIIDDYMYAFKYGTYEPIKTLKDILESQCDHYMQLNGRFIVHCVVQLFCGILGVEWFRIFNTIMFVLFCAMTTRLICNSYRVSIVWYAVVTFSLWCFIPKIGLTILGNIACCVNYLWVGTATLAFIILWQKISQEDKEFSILGNIGLGIVGAIIGSLQESFSIPVAGALFIYYCFHFKKFRGSIVWLVCGYWLGALALIVAPGNFVRLQKELSKSTEGILMISIRRLIEICSEYWLFIVSLVVHAVLYFRNKERLWGVIKHNVMLYLMFFIGLAFSLFIAYTGGHQLFFIVNLMLYILWSIVYTTYNDFIIYYKKMIIAMVCLIAIILYVDIYRHRRNSFIQYEDYTKEIILTNDGSVNIYKYNSYCSSLTWIGKKYTFNACFEPHKRYLSLYHKGYPDAIMSFVPFNADELDSSLTNNNLVSKNVWYVQDYYGYVIKISDAKNVEDVQIKVTYPINGGISRIKRRILGQDLYIDYILTQDLIENYINHNGFSYYYYYYPVGQVIDIEILN